jgi:hypothetical protein
MINSARNIPRGFVAADPVDLTAPRAVEKTHIWFTVGLYGIVLGLLAVPICSVVVPPLTDYPNHLARMHILSTYANSAALQANYVIAWKLAPYLAMDLIVPPLTRLMSIYDAGRVFLFLCLALFVVGTGAVHAALHRRFSAWPAASALLGYSFVFSYGFLSYFLGAGVWLMSFAGWIVLSRRSAISRVIVGTILALAVYFCHFFAFFGYMLCVGAYELGRGSPDERGNFSALARRGLAAFCPFIPGLILFAFATGQQEGGPSLYATPQGWVVAMFSPFLFPGVPVNLTCLAIVLAIPARAGLYGVFKLAPAMRLPLLFIGVAAVAMPNVIMGVWGVDYRLPVVFMALAIASVSWRDVPARATVPSAAFLVALLAMHVGMITWAWRPIAQQFDDFRAAIRSIPVGARLIPFRDEAGINPSMLFEPGSRYDHLPALAVIERDAYLPYLFKPPMLPVHASPELSAIDTPVGQPTTLEELLAGADPVSGAKSSGVPVRMGMHDYWENWPAHYEVAVELSFGARPVLPKQLKPLRTGGFFNIYTIEK